MGFIQGVYYLGFNQIPKTNPTLLVSFSAGNLCHPVAGRFAGLVKSGQIVRSSKCRRVISNVFKSGGPPDGGNSSFHW